VTDRRTPDATLIEAVRILSRTIQTDDGVMPACLAEAATRLEELVEERRWVPVGERLPEIGVRVLVIDGDRIAVYSWEGDLWWSGECWRDMLEVAFWMPLPPGPEGDA